MRDGEQPEDALIAEAVDQLHHLDDRRDAAEMRIEQLVREADYEDPARHEDSRARPLVMLAIGAAVVVAVTCIIWLLSMCL